MAEDKEHHVHEVLAGGSPVAPPRNTPSAAATVHPAARCGGGSSNIWAQTVALLVIASFSVWVQQSSSPLQPKGKAHLSSGSEVPPEGELPSPGGWTSAVSIGGAVAAAPARAAGIVVEQTNESPRVTSTTGLEEQQQGSNKNEGVEQSNGGAAPEIQDGVVISNPVESSTSLPPLPPHLDPAVYPWRYAERRGNVYNFRVYNSSEQVTNPVLMQTKPPVSIYYPFLMVKKPPPKTLEPSYEEHAAARPIIGGVYRSPYHPTLCNVLLDPCETMRDPSNLVLADSDVNRPPISLYAMERPPPSRMGWTAMYRHRQPRRWFKVAKHEFGSEPRRYSDIGHPTTFLPATNAPLPKDEPWQYSDDVFQDCNASGAIRVLTMRSLGVGYGLTNRLFAYAGIMSLANRIGRHVALDKGRQRFSFSQLVNLTSTVWPSRLRLVKRCSSIRSVDVRYKVSGKGKYAYRQIDRRETSSKPHRVLYRLDSGFFSLRKFPAVLFHDMYLRYPYEQDMDLEANAGSLFCGMQFVNWIHHAAHGCIRRLRELAWQASAKRTRKYAALHLRLETSDSIAMLRGRRAPQTKQVLEFLEQTVAPLLQQNGIEVLVVCSGPLDSALWTQLKAKGRSLGLQVVSKSEVLPKEVKFSDFGTAAYEHEGGVRIKVTSTDAAATDLLILEKADLVLLTTTSSFSAFVYAKRCGGSVLLGSSITWNRTRTQLGLTNDRVSERFPGRIFDNYRTGCSLIGKVFLYDMYLDGSFTKAMEYPCGYQFGEYIVAPPALVPRPPADIDVIAFRFKPDSVLYTDASKNGPWGARDRNDF